MYPYFITPIQNNTSQLNILLKFCCRTCQPKKQWYSRRSAQEVNLFHHFPRERRRPYGKIKASGHLKQNEVTISSNVTILKNALSNRQTQNSKSGWENGSSCQNVWSNCRIPCHWKLYPLKSTFDLSNKIVICEVLLGVRYKYLIFMESKESKDTTIHLKLTFLEFKSPAILNLTRAL